MTGAKFSPEVNKSTSDERGIEKLLAIASSMSPKKQINQKRPSADAPNCGQNLKMSRLADLSTTQNEFEGETNGPVCGYRPDLVINVSFDVLRQPLSEVFPITIYPNTNSNSKKRLQTISTSDEEFDESFSSSTISLWDDDDVFEAMEEYKALDFLLAKNKISPIKQSRKSKINNKRAKEDGSESTQAFVDKKRKSIMLKNNKKLNKKLSPAVIMKKRFLARLLEMQLLRLENIGLKKKLKKNINAHVDNKCNVVKKTEILDETMLDVCNLFKKIHL